MNPFAWLLPSPPKIQLYPAWFQQGWYVGYYWFKGSKDTEKWQVRVSVTCQDVRVLPRIYCIKIISSISALVVSCFWQTCRPMVIFIRIWCKVVAPQSNAKNWTFSETHWTNFASLQLVHVLHVLLQLKYDTFETASTLTLELKEKSILFWYAFSLEPQGGPALPRATLSLRQAQLLPTLTKPPRGKSWESWALHGEDIVQPIPFNKNTSNTRTSRTSQVNS